MKTKRNEQVDKLLENLDIEVIWVDKEERQKYVEQGYPCFSFVNEIPVI
jgi:uncharacterized membrane protein